MGRTYYKMTFSEKTKTIDNKTTQNKAQYSLDRQTAKTLPLSSGDVAKYKFFTYEYVLPEKRLLEKAAAIKRFEYSILGSKFKKQTKIVEKQYERPKPTIKEYNRSNLIYNRDFTFYEFSDIGKFCKLSIESKFSRLNELSKNRDTKKL